MTSVITYFFSIVNPVMSQIFVDELITKKNVLWVSPFFTLLIAFAIIQIISAWINAVYSLRINGKMAVVGSTSYMWKVLRLPMSFFSQRMAGDIQGRQIINETIAQNLVNTIAPLFMNTVMMLIYLLLMMRYSLLITAIGVAVCLMNVRVSRILAKKRINLTRVSMRDAANLTGTTMSGIQMIETIKSSGSENGFFEKWAGIQASVNDVLVKEYEEEYTLGALPEFLTILANILVMILGVWMAMESDFTVGMILTFQGILSSFLAPASSLISASQTIQEMKTSVERINDVMDYPIDPVLEEKELVVDSYDKLKGNIEVKNITFGYSRLGEPVVEDFSMSLDTGKRIAIVGGSGCGKSTIAKLLAGLYKPWSGEILYDGKKLEDIDHNIFTGSVAVVDQDITLFEGTISDNIKMWDDSIEDFEMIMAARDAQIHDRIVKDRKKYGLMVVEDAAQAIFSTYKGKYCGTIGDFGCLSFHETKNFSMGEGGAILINDSKYDALAEIYREKGTNRTAFFRGEVAKYNWVEYGDSYLQSDMNAAYLWAQFEEYRRIQDNRLAIWKRYWNEFSPKSKEWGIELPSIPEECVHNAHMFYIKCRNLEQRTRFISFMKENGILCVFHYVPLHSAPAGLKYGRFSGEDVYTTSESDKLVRLPLYYGMTEDDLNRVIEKVKEFFS